MKKVLIPVTNHATLGATDQPNGTYAPELTHVVRVLNEQGIAFDIASIKGGKAPLYGNDVASDEVKNDEVNRQVLADESFKAKINNTIPVADLDASSYDAVFYPGGFGLLSDLAENTEFANISASLYEQGAVISAVCHGPAALLPIILSNGDALLASTSVTAFTREEEIDFGTIDDIPFLLEEALSRKAALYNKVQPWQELVIEDNRVITGQNPASAHGVGIALARHLAS